MAKPLRKSLLMSTKSICILEGIHTCRTNEHLRSILLYIFRIRLLYSGRNHYVIIIGRWKLARASSQHLPTSPSISSSLAQFVSLSTWVKLVARELFSKYLSQNFRFS